MKPPVLRPIYGLLARAAAGCAGAQVTQQSQAVPVTTSRPAQIVVYPFAVNVDDVTLNQGIIASTYRNVSGEDQTAQQLQVERYGAQRLRHGCGYALSKRI